MCITLFVFEIAVFPLRRIREESKTYLKTDLSRLISLTSYSISYEPQKMMGKYSWVTKYHSIHLNKLLNYILIYYSILR